jgi:hypothetical protein
MIDDLVGFLLGTLVAPSPPSLARPVLRQPA